MAALEVVEGREFVHVALDFFGCDVPRCAADDLNVDLAHAFERASLGGRGRNADHPSPCAWTVNN